MATTTETSKTSAPPDPVTLNDMSCLFRNIASLTGAQDPDDRWVFRGVSDHTYGLIPSIGRHPAAGGGYEAACMLENGFSPDSVGARSCIWRLLS